MKILSVENVVSGYGSMEVLHGFSMDVEKGQIVTVLGPNGSGKTTLLRTVFGEVNPREGKVFFKEKRSAASPPNRWRGSVSATCLRSTTFSRP